MIKSKLFLHFYKSVFFLLLLLCVICFFVNIFPFPILIALIPVGVDYLLRYTFRKNIFYFYMNKGFSVFSLYLYSFLLNAFFVILLNIILNGTGFY